MSYICENCSKRVVFGRQSSHARGVAGKRWKKRAQTTLRTFKPNLQKIGGMLLCTSCISRFKKEGRLGKPRLNRGKRLQIASA